MKKKVLLVDDHPAMLWALKNMLSDCVHFEIIGEATNGDECIEFSRNEKADLIILDIMMPFINGWDLCKKIREKYNVPILMLTARNELQDRVRGLDIGADDYLIKPFG